MSNRIQEAITRLEAKIQALDKAKLDKLESTIGNKLTTEEFCTFQDVKSLAQASGKLSFEESMTIYGILNNYAKSTLAQRTVLTQVMTELLQWKIRGAQ